MLNKLHDLNFDKKAVSMIESFLKHRNQKVILNTCKSDWIELYQGVPQGTVLGPLLFNIYVNDMSKAISNDCQLLQYADDTMTYASHKDENQAIQCLENDVNHLVHFFESHGLTINADKTEFIVFCKQSRNAHVKDKEFESKEYNNQKQVFCQISWCLSRSKLELSKRSEKSSEKNGMWN